MADLLEVADEITEALALVRENRVRLEQDMNAPAAKAAKGAFSAKHAAAAGSLAQALKALSTEARLWAEVIAKVGTNATPEQRTAAALEHLLGLPSGARAQAYEKLVTREAYASQPVPLRLAAAAV